MQAFRRSRPRATALLAGAALALSACGGGGEGGGEAQGDPESGTVSMLHAFTGQEDIAGIDAIIAAFEQEYPNIDVQAQGTNQFEQLTRTRIGGGQTTDILLHPQPGLIQEFVNQGAARPLDFIDRGQLEENLIPGTAQYGVFDDTLYAIPVKLGLKSTVWYSKPAFEAAGYEVPTTQEELLQLTERVAQEQDYAPWCIGIESGEATGWVATDWVEDILLRALGGEDYDRWVNGELDFSSPEVQSALEEYLLPIWTNDEYVFGGQAQIVREPFGTSLSGLIGDQPECLMNKMGVALESFIQENNPEAEFGTDYDFFYYPTIVGTEVGNPALVGGDLAALYSDNAAAQTFMQWLARPEAGRAWAERGAFLSPYRDFDASIYPTESGKRAAEILQSADFVRFDGSDLMPADVGSSSQEGSFWLEMTQFAGGNQQLGESLQQIDELYNQVAGS